MSAAKQDGEKISATRSVHGAITIDTSRFPIVDATFVGAITANDYASAFERYTEIARRGEHIVWLIDMRRFDPLKVDAVIRKKAAAVFAANRDPLMRVSIAEARVIESFLTRNVLTAFDWLTGANKWPCQQFATMPLAEEWLSESYERKLGKPLPRTLRAGIRPI